MTASPRSLCCCGRSPRSGRRSGRWRARSQKADSLASRQPKIGLFALNQHAGAEALERLAPLAEELGYESLWMGEHVVVPDPRRPPSPMEPDEPIHDPLLALAFAAAHTTRIRLATGIVILPSATRSCSRSSWRASTRCRADA